MSISIWSRPRHVPCGRMASVVLFAFADTALDVSQPPMSDLPAALFNSLDIQVHHREDDREWFAGFFTPELERRAERDLDSLDELPRDAKVIYSVQRQVEDPPALGYLQAAWVATTWLCDLGARVVLDAHAIRWHSARSLLARDPGADFDIAREVTIVFETEPTGEFGHLTHTRGLAKFARPDFVLFGVQPSTAQIAGGLLNQLATHAAEGQAYAAGDKVGAAGQPAIALRQYEPGRGHPELHLNNDGLVLDIRAWSLG